MTITIYNQEGAEAGTVNVPAGVLDAKWNPDLVHQAYVAQPGNRRAPLAHTKNRGEVAGGGKKPWAQKHTGRARHGSSRSPIWVGGGITFGPRNDRDFTKKINVKMRRAALLSTLSKKYAEDEVKVVDHLTLPDHKTKTMAGIVKRLFTKAENVLCVVVRGNANAFRAGRNLPKSLVVEVSTLNLIEALTHRNLLIEKAAVDALAALAKKSA
jgi:large subunit ribosomal protein L4